MELFDTSIPVLFPLSSPPTLVIIPVFDDDAPLTIISAPYNLVFPVGVPEL